jgi:hypothetical protein
MARQIGWKLNRVFAAAGLIVALCAASAAQSAQGPAANADIKPPQESGKEEPNSALSKKLQDQLTENIAKLDDASGHSQNTAIIALIKLGRANPPVVPFLENAAKDAKPAIKLRLNEVVAAIKQNGRRPTPGARNPGAAGPATPAGPKGNPSRATGVGTR